MPSLKQGQTVTKDDLNSYYYVGGSLSDPFWVSYTIYDSTTGTDLLIGMSDKNPIKFGIGSYYAPWALPDDEPIGLHKIVWKYKESASSQIKSETEEFQVIPPCSTLKQMFPDFVIYLINQLRIRLRDINPDRDYAFSAPASESTIGGFTRTRGYRWADESLYSHLMQAVNFVNLYPPDTGFELESVPAVWQPIVIQQAMVYALWDLSILWINEEFSYSLNGISLDIQRSDKYQGAASSLQDTVTQQLELAKKRIHIIKGLGQNRYLFSRGAALGPWCISGPMKVFDVDKNQLVTIFDAFAKGIKYSYSMDFERNKLIVNEVLKVWSNGVQELFKMNLDNGSEIICTKTHKFFNEECKELELQQLEIGQKIWVKKNDLLVLASVLNKEFYGHDETYDMEMSEPYRNYVAENIIVHNTGGQNIRRWISGGPFRIGMG